MKKKQFNNKLVLKKSTISNLNLREMGNIIGAHANAKTTTDSEITVSATIKDPTAPPELTNP